MLHHPTKRLILQPSTLELRFSSGAEAIPSLHIFAAPPRSKLKAFLSTPPPSSYPPFAIRHSCPSRPGIDVLLWRRRDRGVVLGVSLLGAFRPEVLD